MKKGELLIVLAVCLAVSAHAGPVPDTGQAGNYTGAVGEDSDYRIHPQSYTKQGADGGALPDTATAWLTVRDNVTGLVKCS